MLRLSRHRRLRPLKALRRIPGINQLMAKQPEEKLQGVTIDTRKIDAALRKEGLLDSKGDPVAKLDNPGGILADFFYEKEFYDEAAKISSTQIQVGDPYPLEVCRALTLPQLQELWFVLLVERNKLFALRHEYARCRLEIPSRHRLDLVAISMDNIRTVIEEREKAKNMLTKGQSEGIDGEYTTDKFGDAEWVRHREFPVAKSDQLEHLQKHHFDARTHPDASIPHHNVREWQLRREEQKYMEGNEYYKLLQQKWNSYRNAKPADNLPEVPPKWWLDLDENQPQFRNGMWVSNLPLVDDEHKERKKIAVNVPGDPNI